VSISRLDSTQSDFEDAFQALLDRSHESDPAIEKTVADIIDSVRRDGDAAVLELTRRFDRTNPSGVADLQMPEERLAAALEVVPPEQRNALADAAQRVRSYHEHQRQESWRYTESSGTVLGQKITPLDRVGLYVPGGKASYPSSVLMTAIPARVAGVGELIMVVPTPDGEVNELVLAAAHLAGVDRVFTIGGAQAVAALAYGTESVPKVDKIVGPGNIFVATAKKQVFGQVGIDMIAGPSEVLIVADNSADPDWVAMDLFAQAEHDELAQAIVITTSPEFADQVVASIERQLPSMERADIIRESLSAQGAVITVANRNEALALTDRVAPEHLEVFVSDPMEFAEQVSHAGAIFVGQHSAEALGDYCAGPNHVLPTAGTARFSSPLGVYDFQKRTSIIQASGEGARAMAATASVLARAELLTAHARSAELRLGEPQRRDS